MRCCRQLRWRPLRGTQCEQQRAHHSLAWDRREEEARGLAILEVARAELRQRRGAALHNGPREGRLARRGHGEGRDRREERKLEELPADIDTPASAQMASAHIDRQAAQIARVRTGPLWGTAARAADSFSRCAAYIYFCGWRSGLDRRRRGLQVR
eukprot:3089187-Prymnesium_polylepis.2